MSENVKVSRYVANKIRSDLIKISKDSGIKIYTSRDFNDTVVLSKNGYFVYVSRNEYGNYPTHFARTDRIEVYRAMNANLEQVYLEAVNWFEKKSENELSKLYKSFFKKNKESSLEVDNTKNDDNYFFGFYTEIDKGYDIESVKKDYEYSSKENEKNGFNSLNDIIKYINEEREKIKIEKLNNNELRMLKKAHVDFILGNEIQSFDNLIVRLSKRKI